MNTNNKPPLNLVQTWIWMMTESDDNELRESGQQKLIAAFGSMAQVQKYLDEHERD